MRFSFIGMSNIGKSTWSKRLADGYGYARIDCDKKIETRLRSELQALGFSGIGGVAKWMGFPSSPDYAAKSARYLQCETEVMQETIDFLQKNKAENTIIDTTGSVIYCDDTIVQALRQQSRIVYLEASDLYVNQLFKRYIAHPKPTIWGDIYQPAADETPRQTLKRCYPILLAQRAQKYRAIADLVIPFDQHHGHGADIIALIGQKNGQP